MKISKTGYKKNSKDKNQPSLLIPSNQITMKGVEFPVFGMDDTGHSQMMYPGMNYSFPGNYVYETPAPRYIDTGWHYPTRPSTGIPWPTTSSQSTARIYSNPNYFGYGGDISIPDLSRPSWLDKYQEGGELKPMSWTEYLKYMGVDDAELKSINPRDYLLWEEDEHTLLKDLDPEKAKNARAAKINFYDKSARHTPHESDLLKDAYASRKADLIDTYNLLYFNNDKQDYSGSPGNVTKWENGKDVFYPGKFAIENEGDESLTAQEILDRAKTNYNLPIQDYASQRIKNRPNYADTKIPYTRVYPRTLLMDYNNPSADFNAGIEYMNDPRYTDISENFYSDPPSARPMSFFPAPSYNYTNVPKRYDEKGNEVVSKYDIPNLASNTYYDFPGSNTEMIYNEKLRLNDITKENIRNIKTIDPSGNIGGIDYNTVAAKRYINDPWFYYGKERHDGDPYCINCDKLAGSEHSQDNLFDYFKFNPQSPSSKMWWMKTFGLKPPRPIFLSQPNATSTGQVQIGWDIWDPKQQQWKAQNFSTEEINRRREEVKVPKDGGRDVEFKDSVIHDLAPYSLPPDIKPGTVVDTNNKPVIKEPKVVKAPTFKSGGQLKKYQDGNEVPFVPLENQYGMWSPAGYKRSDYVPYKDVSGAPYETQDPYIHNFSTVDVPENLSELPSYRMYTYGKNQIYNPFSGHISRAKPNAKPINEYGDIGSEDLEDQPLYDQYPYRTTFDPKTGYNYELNKENLQPFQSIPMEGDKGFNLRRFVLNPYEGDPQTGDLYIRKDKDGMQLWDGEEKVVKDKENFIPKSYSREETMDNVFKDLYAQNLYKFNGDRDAAYNATSEFMKDRVEPQYKGKYYEYMNNPNVSARDKLNINLKGTNMTVNPEQSEDYVRQTITDKLLEEHPEYMEKDESGNYKISDEDFSNLVKADPRYRKKLNEYNDVLQDWYVTNKNMSPEEAKALVEKDLYKNVTPNEKRGPKVVKAPTFKSGGWLDTYDSMTPAWSKNPEGNWVVKAQKGLQYTVEPTRADSLELLNNSINVLNYFNSKNYDNYSTKYYNNDGIKEKSFAFIEGLNKDFDPDTTRLTPTGSRTVPLNEYYKPVDKNKFYQREAADGILDTRSPMQLYDRRILPTTGYTYDNINKGDSLFGDAVAISGYDPLSITPWDMLTEDQKKT